MTDTPKREPLYMGPAFNTPVTSEIVPKYYREDDDDSPLPPEPLPPRKGPFLG